MKTPAPPTPLPPQQLQTPALPPQVPTPPLPSQASLKQPPAAHFQAPPLGVPVAPPAAALAPLQAPPRPSPEPPPPSQRPPRRGQRAAAHPPVQRQVAPHLQAVPAAVSWILAYSWIWYPHALSFVCWENDDLALVSGQAHMDHMDV